MADVTTPGTNGPMDVITPQEAQLRHDSGGYLPNGQPAPQNALVDTQSSMTYKRGKGNQINVAPQAPDQAPKSQMDIDAQITGAPNAPSSTRPTPTAQSFFMRRLNDDDLEDRLRKVATDAKLDTGNLPPNYFHDMAQQYRDASNPETLHSLRTYINQSGIGHFMHGAADAGGGDVTGAGGLGGTTGPLYGKTVAALEAMGIDSAKSMAKLNADKFFNGNIQARIIDGSKYYDSRGNYTPPATYQAGKILGDPSTLLMGIAGIGAAGWAAKAAYSGLNMAGRGTMAFILRNTGPVGRTLGRLIQGSPMEVATKLATSPEAERAAALESMQQQARVSSTPPPTFQPGETQPSYGPQSNNPLQLHQ